MMPMMITRDDAVRIIGNERMALMRSCYESAWNQYETIFRPVLPLCSLVGLPNIIHELVTQQVRDRFVGVGTELKDNTTGGRFLLEVDRAIILSFKKLTKNFQTTNNPTDTSEAFDMQEPGIEGISDLPRITVGYQLGLYGTEMAGIWLAFLIGKETVWHDDLQTGERSIEFEFPREERSAADKERDEAAAKKRAEEERQRRAQGTDDATSGDGGNGVTPGG